MSCCKSFLLTLSVTVILSTPISLFRSVQAATGTTWSLPSQGSVPRAKISQTFAIGAQTKVFDLGTSDLSAAPIGWAKVGFNDHSWANAQRVPVGIYRCFTTAYGSFAFGDSREYYDMYWGSNENHAYLFRQTFTLPPARSYNPHYVISLPFLTTFAEEYVNGVVQHTYVSQTGDNDATQGTDIFAFDGDAPLHAGTNVLAVYVSPARKKLLGQACSILSLQFTVDITTQSRGIVSTNPRLTPLTATVLTDRSVLKFAWGSYPGAAYYYLQCWLVQPAPGVTVGIGSVMTVTSRVAIPSATVSTRSMPPGVYHWRVIAVGASGRLLTPWTVEQAITIG